MKALSGNAAAVVFCARSYDDWDAQVKAAFGPEATASEVYAYVNMSTSVAYFEPETCGTLERWFRGRPSFRYEVAAAAYTFAHEAAHMGGVNSERAAECGTLAKFATILRVHFGVKNPVALREMVKAGRAAAKNYGYGFRC